MIVEQGENLSNGRLLWAECHLCAELWVVMTHADLNTVNLRDVTRDKMRDHNRYIQVMLISFENKASSYEQEYLQCDSADYTYET